MKNYAYISLGSNIGDREYYLEESINQLNRHPDVEVIKMSSIYETDPVGYIDQELFLNMVIKIATNFTPYELLAFTQKIEYDLGRSREVKWGPRTIDLDILLYNNENIETEQLTIPHPRMFERSFVLIPLFEIDRDVQWPNQHRSLLVLIDQLKDKKGVRIWKQKNGEEGFALLES
ncbi:MULTISPECIES: 2-amino-4-hydroxy-6-hydroxymethyldihydropteridine diphosphokinase [Aeribacillus]|jgi:2-amino-4-hydroxy-6-hydroxymethyldihydropteridine diphosphokinase|uniref:2-amino-4-hydroxy-6-hydroxymethyldihydropteridine diphosphokinase n=1 Tax=Aeribacillus pallidus TaxID=33936 RepID=A0A165Y514_9BACI|nr:MULTISPECIES: 2-amino-4-hydroxy-6-hydroxymethyldihydropteridine diphosphokinase [Aeribacillus]REJ20841.1 MAG: 2-amino-4-hydroxy-6-hydroxymethyldihydropteridine diphosphokinase [Bacillaceae bacterium]KZN96735.1 2-amino-4-hydroxy-6-hydroxymethyldihydropteridine pyrophosphokinase [Aeribacillus pallidus]MED0716294.1 2-amino-4-hydroxy-6-hydroxymethyldihydropteridine diphosphokinase [Aeribacillus composti]MED0744901.1 2-amino-4-hydroxy-6-hydroxymethyldihydropteridine diphosphokinase [Aeribacillus 